MLMSAENWHGKVLPLTKHCGARPSLLYSQFGGWFYKCPKCGVRSEANKYLIEARKIWNKMVEEENGKSIRDQ